MNYSVRKYNSGYREAVLELQCHLWSEDPVKNDEYLSWKYEYNPYLNGDSIYIVCLGEEVVGMRGVLGVHWQRGADARRLPVACMGDLVIHPDHRDKGLIKLLMDFAMEDLSLQGIEYVLSLSPGNLTQISAFAGGWRCLATLEEYEHPGRFWRVRRKIRYHLKRKEAEPLRVLDRSLGRRVKVGGKVVQFVDTPRSEQMAELVGQLEREDRLMHDRSDAFFSWRFKNSLTNYRFLYCGVLDGFLVLQTSNDSDVRKVRIVDWEAKDGQALEALFKAALKLCRFTRLSITLKPSESELAKLLTPFGFTKKEFGKGVADYRPMYLIRAVSSDASKVDWTCGDLDVLEDSSWDIRPIISDGV